MTASFFQAVREALPEDLSAPFLLLPDGGALSYGDMLARSAQLGHALVGQGVRPGDRVAAQVDKSPDNLMLYLATQRIGAVFLALNTAYTPSELAYFLSDAEPTLTVCRPTSAEAIAPLLASAPGASLATLDAAGGGSLAEMADAQASQIDDVALGGEDLAAILYTSGTTGRSKGAMLTQTNMVSNAVALRDTWAFTGQDRLLHALPIYHTHGLFVATNTLLLAGGSMIFLPTFDADEVIRLLPGATSMMGVPTFYVRLLQQEGFTADLVRHMRLFISGSAPLSAETHAEFKARTGHAILERYGMTETGMNTSNPYEGERRPGSVGFPLPGVDIRIADPETGAERPAGEVGVIEIKGPNVFKGYWRMPDKTAAEFRSDGFFISGDLGRIDADGYIHIVGRDKDLIISGGFNVYPAEVEALLDAQPGVAESAVIGVPHPDFGEGVTAVVAAKPGAKLDEDEIIAALSDELAKYKQPKRVIVVEALPRNAMGKIQKADLRETYGALYG